MGHALRERICSVFEYAREKEMREQYQSSDFFANLGRYIQRQNVGKVPIQAFIMLSLAEQRRLTCPKSSRLPIDRLIDQIHRENCSCFTAGANILGLLAEPECQIRWRDGRDRNLFGLPRLRELMRASITQDHQGWRTNSDFNA